MHERRVSGKNYTWAKFVWVRLPVRLLQMPTMPIDVSVIASKADTTLKAIAYWKSRLLTTYVTVEHAVQDKQRKNAQVILLLFS